MLLLLRVALSLACVVGLIWFAGRRLSGSQARRTPAGPTMRVVGRQALGRHAGVAVVAIGNRRLLLGYGEQQVTMLTELAPVMEPAPLPVAPRSAAAAPASSLPAARVTPESLLSGQPSARPALDIDALLAQARVDAEPLAASEALAPTVAATVPAPRPAVDGVPVARSALDGSILSLDTWRRALETLQDRTVRR
ncbi:flagellar biosynthetic protein FliO [Cellulomonas sp.]|uniref:flagellar biosynthetic protein FliO n=1 Tax=Cellulomonas sp. TaxID=40001 RepID=UPI002E3437CD|nr:flagellar biosynthetic protein FliO [Cellulomonas sp.]